MPFQGPSDSKIGKPMGYQMTRSEGSGHTSGGLTHAGAGGVIPHSDADWSGDTRGFRTFVGPARPGFGPGRQILEDYARYGVRDPPRSG